MTEARDAKTLDADERGSGARDADPRHAETRGADERGSDARAAGEWPPPRAVVFDWGGTLTPWHAIDVGASWAALAGAYLGAGVDSGALADALAAADDEAWARVRGADHLSARFEDVLAQAGVEADTPAGRAGLAAYREFWEPHTWTDPQVGPLWETLRGNGIRVGVLSNTTWDREYHDGIFARDGVGHLIDAAVYSSELTHAKPHPEIFAEAARRLGVAAAECVYVGDRAFEDVHGGHRAGMRTILVPHSDVPAGQLVDLPDAPTPDAVVHELADIPGVLAAWGAFGGEPPARAAEAARRRGMDDQR